MNSLVGRSLARLRAILTGSTPAMTGRGSFPAGYSIVHIGHKTDPKGHWRDYGDKTFNIGGRADKEEALAEAIAWANERFGKREWVRDPYGTASIADSS